MDVFDFFRFFLELFDLLLLKFVVIVMFFFWDSLNIKASLFLTAPLIGK